VRNQSFESVPRCPVSDRFLVGTTPMMKSQWIATMGNGFGLGWARGRAFVLAVKVRLLSGRIDEGFLRHC